MTCENMHRVFFKRKYTDIETIKNFIGISSFNSLLKYLSFENIQ